jgi:hypothetical protein
MRINSPLRVTALGALGFAALVSSSAAKPREPQLEPATLHSRGSALTPPRASTSDTIWIAEWTFDTGGACDDSGWKLIDNRILNDGVTYWDIVADFDAIGNISGNAAALGYQDNVCCAEPDGYDNDWYQAIRILYDGAGDLSLDYLVDSEEGYDFFLVEEDSACASFAQVDYSIDPSSTARAYRTVLFSDSGLEPSSRARSACPWLRRLQHSTSTKACGSAMGPRQLWEERGYLNTIHMSSICQAEDRKKVARSAKRLAFE